VDLGPPIPAYWSFDIGAPALKTYVEAHPPPPPEGEEAESPAMVASDLDAAKLLLADVREGELKALVKGADAAEDFKALCFKLRIPAHPAVVAGLARLVDTPTTFAVRGWACDLASLSILMGLLITTKVTQLRFWGCGLSAKAFELVVAALPPAVTTLYLEGDAPADDAPFERLLPLLMIPTLKILSLRCSSISVSELQAVAEELSTNSHLVALSLWGNPIGDEGAAVVLAALRSNTTLRSLNLGRTRLTDAVAESVQAMYAAVEPAEPPADPPPEETGAEEPPLPPPPNETMTVLDMGYNSLTAKGLATLQYVKESNPQLTKLDLTGNPCGPIPEPEPEPETAAAGK